MNSKTPEAQAAQIYRAQFVHQMKPTMTHEKDSSSGDREAKDLGTPRAVRTKDTKRQMERPLTLLQRQALNQFGRKWKQCPPLIHVSTLMSLWHRKLIEHRTTMPYIHGLTQSYKSFVYEWRKAPSVEPKGT